mmetsp:Transcript_589/g.1138  ORF Transcript_589/g.1138 Transcript_589/m.1138 type:complete len:273 (-) Transcript_589:1098-1916(-)
MPTPTCAFWIIVTSFAPSPIARVIGSGLIPSRTISTSNAFCRGLTRQAMTTLQAMLSSSNMPLRKSLSMIDLSVGPVMTRARWSRLAFWSSPFLGTSSASSFSCSTPRSCRTRFSSRKFIFSGCVSVRRRTVIPGWSTLQLYPMLMAVSTLSPVKTHSLIPASARLDMVSATSSCNLSSIAVTPRICRSFSISSATSPRRVFRCLPTVVLALSYFSFQILNSSSEISLCATSNVRRPSFEYASRWSLYCSLSVVFSSQRSKIMLSAPLIKST